MLLVTNVYTGGEGEVAISFRFSHAGSHVAHDYSKEEVMLHMINDDKYIISGCQSVL